MTQTGRPRADESDARRHTFLRLIAEGVAGDEAARQARIKPERALAILTPLLVTDVREKAERLAA